MDSLETFTLPDVIETSRLRLRPYEFKDVDDVLSYAADPDFGRYLPLPNPYTLQSAQEFIARQVLLEKESHQAWGIELYGRVVGGINLRFSEKKRVGEMGYSIAKRCWGKGYMTEAAGAIVDAAFIHLFMLRKIKAAADLRNVGSWRVMEKIGMTREGLFRKHRILNNEVIDEVWTGILREEWEARSNAA